MKSTTMCILSVFFGALFAVACGVGDKEANASDVLLTKHVVAGSCTYEILDVGSTSLMIPVYPDEYHAAMEDIADNDAVYTQHLYCDCDQEDDECDGDGSNLTYRLVYIK